MLLRPTEAVDMVETKPESSRAHVYWLKNNTSFSRGCVYFAASQQLELSTWSKRGHVNTLFERADSKFRDRRRYRYCQNVVHISDVCMLVQTVSITRCALPFRDRRSCRHCRSAETYIRQMLVQRYNNSNNTFAASADRSCRHGRNATRFLTRTRLSLIHI